MDPRAYVVVDHAVGDADVFGLFDIDAQSRAAADFQPVDLNVPHARNGNYVAGRRGLDLFQVGRIGRAEIDFELAARLLDGPLAGHVNHADVVAEVVAISVARLADVLSLARQRQRAGGLVETLHGFDGKPVARLPDADFRALERRTGSS